MTKKKVYAVVTVSVLAVSWSPIFIREMINNGVSPDVAAFYRMLFSVALLMPFALLNKNHRRGIAALATRDRWITALSGAFLALHFLCWFFSIKYTSVFSATVLVNLTPVFLLAAESLWFHHRPAGKEISGVLLALLGLVLLSVPGGGEGGSSFTGNLLAILAAGFMGGYMLCSRSVRPKLHILPFSFLVYAVCALGIGVWVVTAGRPLAGYSLEDFALFSGSAVVCTLLGHSLFQWSLRYIRASTLSVFILGEPVGAAILAFLLYQEVLGPVSYIGGAVLLVGIALFNIRGKKQPA
mgnify:CR=1 FL=1